METADRDAMGLQKVSSIHYIQPESRPNISTVLDVVDHTCHLIVNLNKSYATCHKKRSHLARD